MENLSWPREREEKGSVGKADLLLLALKMKEVDAEDCKNPLETQNSLQLTGGDLSPMAEG